MSTFKTNFENAISMLETTKENRTEWHKKERTLAKLLKLAQSKEMLPITAKIFKEVGLPTNGKLTQTRFLNEFCLYFVEKKEVKLPAYINKSVVWAKDSEGKCKKDKEGKKIAQTDEKGEIVYNYKLTAIKEGTWTLEKLLRACTK